MRPFIKWPGGKERELQYILPNLPQNINNYVEPFLGGGAVYLAMQEENINGEYIVNDLSHELIDIYECVKNEDVLFFHQLEVIDAEFKRMKVLADRERPHFLLLCRYVRSVQEEQWLQEVTAFVQRIRNDLQLNENLVVEDMDSYVATFETALLKRLRRMKQLDAERKLYSDDELIDLLECVLKSTFYIYIRKLYNERNELDFLEEQTSAMYLFIRENCFSAMHRTNANGDFNVPYGGVSYNKHDLLRKIESLRRPELINRLDRTNFYNADFAAFLEQIEGITGPEDFWFIDPPYDSEFNEYSQNTFDLNDQERLAEILSQTQARVMIVIKHTEYIYNLYSQYDVFRIRDYRKTYDVNFQNRNNRMVTHLLITNYDIEEQEEENAT